MAVLSPGAPSVRWCLVWLLAATGCLQTGLVPCGDRACPVGSVCLEEIERCVAPDQLASCAGLGPDEPCDLDGASGVCRDGACTPVSCGNGFVDPGEICDDGNLISGDGCNGTCSSAEVCGDGVVDVAVGEGCDCGTDTAKFPCKYPNSDDPAAECTPDCRLRTCGDNQVNAVEQCDGAVPAGASCEQFGYYAGTMSCSAFCQLDPGPGCTGRCGDGTLDDVYGEYCDGAAPPGESCLDFGRDLGPLGCNAVCGPATSGCKYLGFTRAHGIDAQVLDLWGGDGRIGVVYETGFKSGDAYVLANGTEYKATGAYSRIAGTPSTVWAAGEGLARWSAATNQWTVQTPPWSPGLYATDLWASDTLGLFVLLDSLKVWRRDPGGVWTSMSITLSGEPRFASTRVTPYLLATDGALVWDPSGWQPYTAQIDIIDITEQASGLRLVLHEGVLSEEVLPEAFMVVFQPVGAYPLGLQPDGADGFILRLRESVFGGPAGDNVHRMSQTPSKFFAPIPTRHVVSDGRGTLYAAWDTGDVGLYRIERGDWSSLPALQPLASESVSYVPGGSVAFYSSSSLRRLAPSFDQVSLFPAEGCRSAMLPASGGIYCLGNSGTLWEGDASYDPGAGATVLWVAPDEQGAAVGGPKLFSWRSGTTWNKLSTTLEFLELEGTAITELYAIAGFPTVGAWRLYRFDGAAWMAMSSAYTDLHDLTVTPTTVYAVADGTLIALDRATQLASVVTTPVTAGSVTGSSSSDLFLADAAPGINEPLLWRYDGSSWSPLRNPENVSSPLIRFVRLEMAGYNVIALDAPNGAFEPLQPVYVLQRTGAW